MNSICFAEGFILQAAHSFEVLLSDLGITSNCNVIKFVESEEKKIQRAV